MTDLSKRLRGLPAWTTLRQAVDEIDKLEAELEAKDKEIERLKALLKEA